MGYLAMIIALIQVATSNTTGMTLNQGVDLFLDKWVAVNHTFLTIAWVVWIAAIVISLILILVLGRGEYLTGVRASCGCYVIPLVILPLWQWVFLHISIGMANAWGPTGMIDQTKFIFLAILTVLLGGG
jgi:hypothetical protein